MMISSVYLYVLVLSSVALQGSVAGTLSEQDLQVVKEKRIAAIKYQILSKLGLTEAPTRPARSLSPGVMETYYSKKAGFEREARSASVSLDNSYFAKTVNIIINPKEASGQTTPPPSAPSIPTPTTYDSGSDQTEKKLSFTIHLPSGSSNDIEYAELKFKKTCPDFWSTQECHSRGDLHATVNLYLLLSNTTIGTTKLFVTGRSLILNDGMGWEEFEITEAVQQCLTLEPFKTEIHLEIEINLNLPVLKNDDVEASFYDIDPYAFFRNVNAKLETDTQLIVSAISKRGTEHSTRLKRQVNKDFCLQNHTTNCCVRNLTINFKEDLGWDWILAPTEYDSNYCSGNCPYSWPSATMHADILQRLQLNNPSAAAEPCCVPSTLLPLTIVREDDNAGFIFEPLSEMIVDSCICR